MYDTDAGLQGYNLFAYCGSNPVNRIDISGADSERLDDLDLDDDEVTERGGGGRGDRGHYRSGNGGPGGRGSGTHSGGIDSGAGSGGQLANYWHQGTFSSPQESMEYHYNKHVKQEGLSDSISIEQYTQDALDFAQNNSSMMKYEYNYKYHNTSWNWKYTAGRGGMFTSSGRIITFWYTCKE